MADIANSNLYNFQGIPNIEDALVVLVKTEWNAPIVDKLEAGCQSVLQSHNVRTETVVVPGAVEIPFAIQQYWTNNKVPAAFVALGCVIRGGTPHFEYVCQSVTTGITQLNLSLPVPVIFGVLTVDDVHQAEDRVGGPHGHKGEEAAMTAIKMIALTQKMKEQKLR